MSKKFMLTAFSKDRPGIVADISQIIYENGYNLEDSAIYYYATGVTEKKGVYKNGQYDGLWWFFYPNGVLKKTIYYALGAPH